MQRAWSPWSWVTVPLDMFVRGKQVTQEGDLIMWSQSVLSYDFRDLTWPHNGTYNTQRSSTATLSPLPSTVCSPTHLGSFWLSMKYLSVYYKWSRRFPTLAYSIENFLRFLQGAKPLTASERRWFKSSRSFQAYLSSAHFCTNTMRPDSVVRIGIALQFTASPYLAWITLNIQSIICLRQSR